MSERPGHPPRLRIVHVVYLRERRRFALAWRPADAISPRSYDRLTHELEAAEAVIASLRENTSILEGR